jgi:beta-galactosidase
MGNPPANARKWRAAGIDRLVRTVEQLSVTQPALGLVEVSVRARLCAPEREDGIESELVYRVYGDGQIGVENRVTVSEKLPFVPRIGVELVLPPGIEQVVWFGRGPHENYVDRKCGAAVGLYQSTVDEQFTPYVYTSESGGREDVRWIALTDTGGIGLMAVADGLLHVDALHYTVADLAQAGHPHELTRLDQVILHLDGWHMGVGGDDGWWSKVHPEFLIQPGSYRYAFRLRPVAGGDDLAALGREGIGDAL